MNNQINQVSREKITSQDSRKVPLPDFSRYGVIWEYTVEKRPKYFDRRPTVRLYRLYTRKTDIYVITLDIGPTEWVYGANESPELAFESAINEWNKYDNTYNPFTEALNVYREAIRQLMAKLTW